MSDSKYIKFSENSLDQHYNVIVKPTANFVRRPSVALRILKTERLLEVKKWELK
jgi:hypothetical protein